MADDLTAIHIFCQDFEEFFTRYSEQIGRGEIFIEAEELLAVKSPVELFFMIVYEDLVFFKVRGTVTSSSEYDQIVGGVKKPRGMAVKLNEFDEKIRSFIVTLVKTQIKSEISKGFTT